jgi:hypothetical protein
MLGPAGALADHLSQRGATAAPELSQLLQRLSSLEAPWLNPGPEAGELTETLQGLGWVVQPEIWDEHLSLELTPAVVQRWLGQPTAPYRRRLETVLSASELALFEQELRAQIGAVLPQRLRHHLLIVRRQGNAPPA